MVKRNFFKLIEFYLFMWNNIFLLINYKNENLQIMDNLHDEIIAHCSFVSICTFCWYVTLKMNALPILMSFKRDNNGQSK